MMSMSDAQQMQDSTLHLKMQVHVASDTKNI